MSSALLICEEVSHAVRTKAPLDFSIHTVLLLALPANIDVFASVSSIKCPCGSDMVYSSHPEVHRWALYHMKVSHGANL